MSVLPYTPTTPQGQLPEEKVAMSGKLERPYEYQAITSARGEGLKHRSARNQRRWMPLFFRTWFVTLLVILMIGISVALEVALHFSQKNSGWPTKSNISNTDPLHFLYTILPEAVALGIVATWVSADLGIKQMQPFVDLARGNARCETTLLLDYTSSNNFVLVMQAFANRHYVVLLSTATVLLGLALQTLAASLFIVRSVWLFNPDFASTTSLATMGLSSTYATLIPFVAAAGYAEAAAVFNVTKPGFISGGWAVAPFNIPDEIGNGTVYVNTTAIKSVGNCIVADSHNVSGSLAAGFNINATFESCLWQWNINTTTPVQFGLDILSDCDSTNSIPDQFKPPIFFLFDATDPNNPEASVAFCRPNLTLANVAVTANVQTNTLDTVTVRTDAPFSGGGNLTGAGPLNGRAFNGVAFNLTKEDAFVDGRMTALQTILPAAMFQTSTVVNGTNAMFVNNGAAWATVVDAVYETYLGLLANSVYFVSNSSTLPMVTYSYQSRLELNALATHIVAALLLLIAVLGSLAHVLQRRQMADANLRHSPGTIAAAGAIIADTDVGRELDPGQTTEEIIATFSDRRLGKDKTTGKVVLH